jgi:endo-1,4-beta-xylanase
VTTAIRTAAAILVAAGLALPAPAQAAGLRTLTARPLVGTAVDATALAAEPDYAAVLGREFSMVTPENVMKWKYVERQEGVEDYSQADQLVSFAQAHGQLVRGHTLVWFNALPAWLTEGDFTDARLAAILERHVTDEVTHFRGEIYAWDVVNEPFEADGDWRATMWYQALGPDYVADALRWAHAADPAAALYINEYDAEAIGPRSDALYALVRQLVEEDVPIDGVGFQAHLDIADPFPADLQSNLERFAALGVDVAITEADVRIPVPATPAGLATQAGYFGRLVASCVAVPRCRSFTVWGFTDRHSWVPSAYAHQGAATPFDANLAPKPAYFAIRDALLPPVLAPLPVPAPPPVPAPVPPPAAAPPVTGCPALGRWRHAVQGRLRPHRSRATQARRDKSRRATQARPHRSHRAAYHGATRRTPTCRAPSRR